MLSKHYNRRPGKDPDKRPILCLTFDDGPDPVYTPQLLDLLDHWQIPAAFFVVGRQAAAHPDLLRRMEASGHTVGLHSHTHKSAYIMSPRQTAKDFCQSVEALRTAGLHPKYYRPPWGHATPASRRLAGQYGLTPVYWDVMAQDWKASITEDEILHRLLLRTGAAAGQAPSRPEVRPNVGQPGGRPASDGSAAPRPGAIVCLHDGRGRRQAPQRMVHALGRAVEIWKAEGFRFVTLEEYLTTFPKKAAWRRGL
ncbi:MAG: polysaccharide deacetylase family protein [Anaerovoracaceae bacterium]